MKSFESKYDFVTAYRIYPKVSKVPPIYADDKYKLAELCLKSFIDSLGSLRTRIYAILDNCPSEYEQLFKKYIDEDDLELIKMPGVGNPGTFGKQMDILLEQNESDIIFFAEDDYFYLKNQFHFMIDLIKEHNDTDFISPFDHLDYYTLALHNYNYDTIEAAGKKWRTAGTTCMTFLTTKDILTKTYNVFKTYTKKNYDASLWLSLTGKQIFNPAFYFTQVLKNQRYFKIVLKSWIYSFSQNLFGKRYNLYIPKPSIATHMDDKCLAPDINWMGTFKDT